MRYIRCAQCGERMDNENDYCYLDRGLHNEVLPLCEGCMEVLRDDEGITLDEHTINEMINLYNVRYEEDEPDWIGDMWDEAYEERFDEW